MLVVGVAIRLGKRPATVARWPIEELALVAGYCELESEAFKKEGATTPAPAGASPTARRTVYVAAPKEKQR